MPPTLPTDHPAAPSPTSILRSPTGHGIALRRQHFSHILEHGPGKDVDWMEVISEDFFAPGGRPWAVLDTVRRELPIVLHGVSMGLGNVERVPDHYLRRLREVIDRLEPAAVSDHLCWGGYGGHDAHDLLPLPYTEEALDHVVAQITEVQEKLGRRIMVENVSSYLRYRSSQMPEWEFLNEVSRRADCGVLLDVNNIFVSARNHGFAPEQYVDAIDPRRVGQVHVAGNTPMSFYILDAHEGPVPEEVWAIYRRLVRRIGARSTLVEWDEELPRYEVLVAEARRAADNERAALYA